MTAQSDDVERPEDGRTFTAGGARHADLSALLDRLEAAAAAATPGPWATDEALPGSAVLNAKGFPIVYAVSTLDRAADAALIVAAVNALPTLIAELRAHQAAVQAVRELADSLEASSRRWAAAVDEADNDTDRGYSTGRAHAAEQAAIRIRAAVAALDPKEPS